MSHVTPGGHYRIDTQFLRGPWARQVGAYGLAVYNVLISYAGNDTHEAWPCHQTIADQLGCSRRTVIRSMAVLERHNIIRRSGRLKAKRQRSNLYTLLPPEQWRRPVDRVRPASVPTRDAAAPNGSGSPAPQSGLPSPTSGDSVARHSDSPAPDSDLQTAAEEPSIPSKRSPLKCAKKWK